jgi:hypothetical protein
MIPRWNGNGKKAGGDLADLMLTTEAMPLMDDRVSSPHARGHGTKRPRHTAGVFLSLWNALLSAVVTANQGERSEASLTYDMVPTAADMGSQINVDISFRLVSSAAKQLVQLAQWLQPRPRKSSLFLNRQGGKAKCSKN